MGGAMQDNGDGNGYTLSEAAERLGTTPDALRKRIQRGSLPGRKVDGRWRVTLAGNGPAPDAFGQRVDDRTDAGGQGVDGDAPAGYRELVAALQGEVTFLREEVRRRDQLLAAVLQRIPELPATAGPAGDGAGSVVPGATWQASTSTAQRSRPWWRFWKRGEG